MISGQTGKYPTRSRSGNKYTMIMVEIDSSAILVKPMKSQKDAKMIRAYNALLLWPNQAGIYPKQHVMDNKVYKTMTSHIWDTADWNLYHRGAIAKMQQRWAYKISRITS